MATSTQLAIQPVSTRHSHFVLWHLLSLDAPTVAALWTWFLARANHTHLPASSLFAMFLAVWFLYAVDRLLDTSNPAMAASRHRLEERHRFHRSHYRAFTFAIVLASLALAVLLPRLLPESLRLYLVLGALLVAWFVLIHTAAPAGRLRLPKELAVGVFFSAATFIPTISRQPALRLPLLPAAILFAVLCSLNCLFIYTWEHPATSLLPRLLIVLATLASLAGLALARFDRQLPWPVPAACALAGALLLMLHSSRNRLSRNTLRAAADACLLTAASAAACTRAVIFQPPAQPDFDPIARPYRWLEYLAFGRALERCRLHFLPRLAGRTHALVFGDGDGRFLARLLAANPTLTADAVDTSAAMLALLRDRCVGVAQSRARLRIHQADALAFSQDVSAMSPPACGRTAQNRLACDLVVTHFFLDCLTQLQVDALAAALAAHLAPNAFWLVSEFRIPPGPLETPARLLVRALYLAFRLTTGLRPSRLPDHASALTRIGLIRIDRHLSRFGLLTTELWSACNRTDLPLE